jgi:catechol 2,3-dioxygenase-like lactoylglutathione lyase family enzyme
MSVIDHIILNVNDIDSSVAFYVDVLGFKSDGTDGPFTIIRVNEGFTIQLAPWGTKGNEHLAFALTRESFDRVFSILKDRQIPFGDSFHSVGNNIGPGLESGAKGLAPTIYMNDPNKHLIEIRTYE